MMQIDDDNDFEYRPPKFYNKVEEDGKTEEVVGTGLSDEDGSLLFPRCAN